MKKIRALLVALCLLGGCTSGNKNAETDQSTPSINPMHSSQNTAKYRKITPSEAKEIMEGDLPYILVDVRTQEEFSQGYIKGAVLLPDTEVKMKAAQKLPDKDALILVYCRSGRRSAAAAKQLLSLGYRNVLDFGGILDWPYEIIK